MFEFFFKYPPAIFEKGKLVLLSPWPVWVMALLFAAAAAGLFWHMRSRLRSSSQAGVLRGARPVAIWLAQCALIAVVLFMLWRPAISVARLRPQQNVVAVLIDNSRSMGIADSGTPRIAEAENLFNSQLAPELRKKFQVRLYAFGRDAARIDGARNLTASENATRIGDSLHDIAAEAGSMPLGAIVLMTDGGDNTGGVDRETISQLRQLRVPVHTIGFGPEHFTRDIEVEDVSLPSRALTNSRLSARVAFRQNGFAGQRVKLTVRENGRLLGEQQVTVRPDAEQSEAIVFDAGDAGAHAFDIGIEPMPGEENTHNNSMVRLVDVSSKRRRVLYIEGEPRWEFKFIRRAFDDDQNVEIVSMLRTTQNKIYRQGISSPNELEEGFPTKPEDLFAYDGLIIGSVEANYFTPQQQQMIRDFADRRGGGVLFLAGRFALSDGGYANTPMAEMLPLRLPGEKTWSRDFADISLTDAGKESPICRLEEAPGKNTERWKKMPQVANYAVMGSPKPGATVLMNVAETGHRASPLLAIENYGHGRTAVFATAGSWRWKMLQEHSDRTHAIFWQQLVRWLVTESPGEVISSTPRQVISDDSHVPLRVSVRNKKFEPVSGATVRAHIARPDGNFDDIELRPDPLEAGIYAAGYSADKSGSYVAEFTARGASAGARGGLDKTDYGSDTLNFRRQDGVAENFGAAQNRDLLQKLASDTGGNYYTPPRSKRLPDEIAVSEAGITAHDNLDIWDMPILFLLVILVRGGEWLLRRKWGVV